MNKIDRQWYREIFKELGVGSRSDKRTNKRYWQILSRGSLDYVWNDSSKRGSRPSGKWVFTTNPRDEELEKEYLALQEARRPYDRKFCGESITALLNIFHFIRSGIYAAHHRPCSISCGYNLYVEEWIDVAPGFTKDVYDEFMKAHKEYEVSK